MILSPFLLCFSKVLLKSIKRISSMSFTHNLRRHSPHFHVDTAVFFLLLHQPAAHVSDFSTAPLSSVLTQVRERSLHRGETRVKIGLRNYLELKEYSIVKINKLSLCFQNLFFLQGTLT